MACFLQSMHKCVDIWGGLITFTMSRITTDDERIGGMIHYLRGRSIIIYYEYVHCWLLVIEFPTSGKHVRFG